jgi:leucyl aminopeptidase
LKALEIRVSTEPVGGYDGDAVVVALAEGAPLSGPAVEADAALDGLLSRLMAAGEIRGKAGELTILHTQGKLPASRIAVAGLGGAATGDLFAVRLAMGAAARLLRDRGCRRVATTLHSLAPGTGPRDQGPRAVVEATYVGLYRGAECKTEAESPQEFDELCLLHVPAQHTESAAAAAQAGAIAGEATNYARRLVNLPANQVTPAYLGEEAERIGRETDMEVEVIEPARLRELGMGAFLAVAQGSEQPACLIVLRHRKADNGRRIAFLGKGLTFDSGGISLKPSDGMHLMKSDMAGAAAVLAAMWAVARRKLPLDVIAIIPATENLPSGQAYKPGDVLTSLSGKTIEVISTDAEGRLLLADALAYARQLGATHLIDVATLTGACIIALGHVASGVLGNDNELIEAVLDCGELSGERMWRLPLFPEYRRQLDSKIADLKNVGGRPAGTITGGWFLREFAGDTSWVHIDIAGTAWSEKDEPHQVEGATGVGARTLIALAERMAGAS